MRHIKIKSATNSIGQRGFTLDICDNTSGVVIKSFVADTVGRAKAIAGDLLEEAVTSPLWMQDEQETPAS